MDTIYFLCLSLNILQLYNFYTRVPSVFRAQFRNCFRSTGDYLCNQFIHYNNSQEIHVHIGLFTIHKACSTPTKMESKLVTCPTTSGSHVKKHIRKNQKWASSLWLAQNITVQIHCVTVSLFDIFSNSMHKNDVFTKWIIKAAESCSHSFTSLMSVMTAWCVERQVGTKKIACNDME